MGVNGLLFLGLSMVLRTYHVQAAWGLALGGFPAVFVAAYVVRSLPLTAVRWLVIVVVVSTALTMLLTARSESAATGRPGPGGIAPIP
jgi:uncharacterized membrane protein YfcA